MPIPLWMAGHIIMRRFMMRRKYRKEGPANMAALKTEEISTGPPELTVSAIPIFIIS